MATKKKTNHPRSVLIFNLFILGLIGWFVLVALPAFFNFANEMPQ